MMLININNDQNIDRVHTKMSEGFSGQNNTKLTNSLAEEVDFFQNIVGRVENGDELNLPYDHMYATNTETNDVNLTDFSCQTAESEVKFLKEWLILHLDLIQQQNDEILNKERSILILQQENEMLKERISCMERGAPFEPSKFFENHLEESFAEDMTPDSGPCEEDNKNCIELLDLNCENGNNSPIKLTNFEQNHISDSESQTDNYTVKQFKTEIDYVNKSTLKSECEVSDSNNTGGDFDFTIDNSSDFDPMRNLRMSIRRKRVCSNSSALSNHDSVIEEKRPYRRFRKKRKRILKDTQILTTDEQYATQTGDVTVGIVNHPDMPIEMLTNTNLEVPRWRVKVYASCYTMEGTENLDDEVYNKRHSRLEIDERRRKRWDVQRIREQRVIEKLKQRQERVGSGSRSDDQNERVQSLWPKIEDIKYLEVSEQLPVSAFGCPIPKIAPSEFSLPWLNNPSLMVLKKVPGKRSTVKRKNSKR